MNRAARHSKYILFGAILLAGLLSLSYISRGAWAAAIAQGGFAVSLLILLYAVTRSEKAHSRLVAVMQQFEMERTMAEAVREEIIMPVFTVDGSWKIVAIDFPPITIPIDRGVSFIMPIVRGLGQREFTITWTDLDGAAHERTVTADFDTGGLVLVDVD